MSYLLHYKPQVTSHQSVVIKILIQNTNTAKTIQQRQKEKKATTTLLKLSILGSEGKQHNLLNKQVQSTIPPPSASGKETFPSPNQTAQRRACEHLPVRHLQKNFPITRLASVIQICLQLHPFPKFSELRCELHHLSNAIY